jgi:hypothetical protein
MIKHLLIALPLLVGCSGYQGQVSIGENVGPVVFYSTLPNSYIVDIDPSFTDIDMFAITGAESDWETISGGVIHFDTVVTKCHEKVDVICIEPSPKIVLSYSPTSTVGGLTSSDGYTNGYLIQIPSSTDSGLSPIQMRGILSHEIGHGMGLLHTLSGIMYYTLDEGGSLKVDCDDFEQYSMIRGATTHSDACPNGGVFNLDPKH